MLTFGIIFECTLKVTKAFKAKFIARASKGLKLFGCPKVFQQAPVGFSVP